MTGKILSRCTGWRVAWLVLLLSGCLLTRVQAQETNHPPPFLGSNANYSINSASSNRMVQISTNAQSAGDDNLVWSHNGRYIAADRSDPTATNQINQLRGPKYICVLDVGSMSNILTIGARSSAHTNPVFANITDWTRDDKRILFGFWPTDVNSRCRIMSCSATGAVNVVDFLLDPAPPPNNLHVFSPSVIFDPTVNKERLLFLTATGPDPGLPTSTVNVWTVTYNTGEAPAWTNRVALTAFTTTNKFQSVRWCPELGTNYQQLIDRYAIVKTKTVGKEIIVFNGVRGVLSQTNTLVTNLNDGRLSYRDSNASDGSQATWTYDGVNLMYSKEPQGPTSEIYTIRSAGTNLTPAIFPTPSEFNGQNKQWLSINPAGTRVAFTVNKRIYMLPLAFSNAAVTNAGTTNILSDGGYTRVLVPSEALQSNVSFSITEPNSVDTNQFSGTYMSSAREFSADGSSNGFSFTTNIEMYLQYTASELPTNVSPTNLSIYLYNSTNVGTDGTTGTWSKVSSMVDTNNAYVISTNITHFSVYALGEGAAPGAPANVSASQGTFSNLVRVTWDASVGASGYIVWTNSVSSTSSAAIAISGVSATTWDDTNGGIWAASYYWVQATNDDGVSALSSPVASGWRTMKPFISVLGTNGAAIASGEAASAAKGTDLGSISWGSAVTNALAITNSGTASLTINGWTTNGAGAGHFRAVGIPATVSVNSISNFSVIFSPSAAGSHTAAVAIANNSSNVASYLVYLAGTAVKRDQTITSFPNPGAQLTTNTVQLSAQASSGLAVTNFAVASGSATISGGSNVTFSGAGSVSVTANQSGNTDWNSAPAVTNTFAVTKVTAQVTLNDLAQTYNGSARTITATTAPTGLTVNITYAGNSWAPTNAGIYAVTGVVADVMYQGTTNDVLTVAQALATVNITGLTHIYDGNAKTATVSTLPAGLAVDVTYNGSTAPTNSGSYAVTGTVNDVNYVGTNTATMTISDLPSPTAQAASFVTPSNFVANWSSAETATNYLLDVGSNSGFTIYLAGFSNLAVGNALFCTVTGVNLGSTYYYRVRAQNPGMTSTNSGTISVAILGVPSLGSVIASNILAHTAYLGGSITATNGYVVTERGVYWATNAGTVLSAGTRYAQTGSYDVGQFSMLVSNLPAGQSNYFLAYAVNSQGTNVTSETPFLTRPDAPAVLLPTNVTSSAFWANWQAALGATNYWLDVTPTNSFGSYLAGYSNRIAAAALSLNVTGMSAGVAYYYRVRAENATGISTDSATLAVSAGAIALLPSSLTYTGAYSGTNPASQVFVITNSGVRPFNFTNSVTYSAGASGWWSPAPLTGSIAGLMAGAITGAVINISNINAGTYVATNAVIAGDATNSPQYSTVALTVNKGGQTITNFPNPGTQVITNTVHLRAQASSGLAVTNFAVVSGPAAISGGSNVTFSNTGSVSVVAYQSGNSNWNAALPVTDMFAVVQALAQVNLADLSQVYDGAAKPVTVTTVPAGLTMSVTYNSGASVPVNAGSYSVAAAVVDTYYYGSASGTLVIAKADQTISFPAIPDQVQTSQVTLTATANSGLPVSFSVASGSAVIGAGNVVSFSGAGAVSIAASQAGNGNWNAAANVVNTFNVTAVTANLGIPQNVSATDGTLTGRVVVTWSAVSGAAGYEIWNSDVNNIGTAATLGRSTTTTYNDTSAGARAGLMKYYWLRAWNTVATGAFSAVDSGYALPEAGAEIISGQPAVGDYDGDQKADPAVYHLNSGRLYAWISAAAYSLLEPAIQFHVESGEIPAFGDYDGDGYIDPGVFRATAPSAGSGQAGTWYVWLSSAGYAQVGPILFGVDANDIPVAADYDGDRKTDPGVFHGAEGAWYIWLSAGDYTRLGPLTQFHVGSADIPVPGDYDLDGKADPAVYESAAGAWYLWLSGSGYAPLGPVTFTTTDSHLAVPADYDGDAKCDPAAYIPTDGKWRMWMSDSGYSLTEMELK